jgi:hypothetical protein
MAVRTTFDHTNEMEAERQQLAQEALAAWAQARPRNSGSRLAMYHVHVNTAGLHASAAMGLNGRLLFDSSNRGPRAPFVRAPVTTNNRRIHRDTRHRPQTHTYVQTVQSSTRFAGPSQPEYSRRA